MDNKKRSKKRENKGASNIGGRSHPNSGAVWYRKGDYSNENFLIEDKYTDADYYSLSLSVLNTVEKHANKVGKIPVVSIGFESYKKDYAVLRECDCSHIVDEDIEIIETDKKSKRIYCEELQKKYVNCENIFLFKVKLRDRFYYILMLNDFEDNIDKFFC